MNNLQHAVFDDSTLGTGLVVTDSGLVVTTLADGLNTSRFARSDFGQTEGEHFVQFIFYGDHAGCPAKIGTARSTLSVDTALGENSSSVGWDLANGTIRQNGINVVTGLDPVVKGEKVSVRLDLTSAAVARVVFYRDQAIVGSYALGAVGPIWHFAAALGSTVAGDLSCYVQAGQGDFFGDPRYSDGWAQSPELPSPVRLATEHFLSRSTDSLASARFPGVILEGGIVVRRRLTFWPWGDSQVPISVGDLTIADHTAEFDELLAGDWRDLPVSVYAVDRETVPDDTPVITYYVDQVGDYYTDGAGSHYGYSGV